MCGILLVKSQSPLPLDQHLGALALLDRRGPDGRFWRHRDGIFIGQTLLHITGSPGFYRAQHDPFVAYNGEIYNYKQFGAYSTDAELVSHTLNHQRSNMYEWEGPWAWAWTDFDSIAYATDPQGERCLYRYQDDDILIVSSEIAPIGRYIDLRPQAQPYASKHWPTVRATPWQGVERVAPGYWHDHAGSRFQIDSMFRWRTCHGPNTLEEAVEEFASLWPQVLGSMNTSCAAGLTFSGGVDTSLILAARPDFDHLYTVNTIDKDTVSTHAREFLTSAQQDHLVEIVLDEPTWAGHFLDGMRYTHLPAQSWSWVGQWAIAQACREKVLFTGVGADELFGGYGIYDQLAYNQERSVSPYSLYHDDSDMEWLWGQCLAFYEGEARPATLMMDYLIQITAVDMRGVDLCSQAWSVEPRSPFVHPRVIKFALNLPWQLRQGKPVLKEYFKRFWPSDLIYPKQGFAGHCNDSYAWLGIDIARVPDRQQDWRNILLSSYRQHGQTNRSFDQTIPAGIASARVAN